MRGQTGDWNTHSTSVSKLWILIVPGNSMSVTKAVDITFSRETE